MDFLRRNFLRNETLLSWTFPVIKIRFFSNQNIRGGESDFDDQIINISGGIKPKIDSEIKKDKTIIFGEYVSKILFSNKLISVIK